MDHLLVFVNPIHGGVALLAATWAVLTLWVGLVLTPARKATR